MKRKILLSFFVIATLLAKLSFLQAQTITTNPLAEGNYYIKISNGTGGYLYLTTDGVYTTKSASNIISTNRLSFSTFDVSKKQIFKLTLSGSGYKITEVVDGSYLQENLYLQKYASRYDAAWNCHKIYYNGTAYAARAGGTQTGAWQHGAWDVNGNKQLISTKDFTGVAWSSSTTEPVDSCYQFYFEQVVSITKVSLEANISSAEALIAKVANNHGTALGTYNETVYQGLVTLLDEARSVEANAGATQSEIDLASSDLSAAISSLKNAYLVDPNALADGYYAIYVSNAGSDYYLTDAYPRSSPSTNTSFAAVYTFKYAEDSSLFQKFKVTYDADKGRYKIEGKYRLDNDAIYSNAYINENGSFGGNAYSSSWNTMKISYNGSAYAIQKGESAGVDFWIPSDFTENAVTSVQSGTSTLISDNTIYHFLSLDGGTSNVENEALKGQIGVYYVPGGIVIQGDDVVKVYVYDIQGNMKSNAIGIYNKIALQSGIYVLKVRTSTGSKIQKIVVK